MSRGGRVAEFFQFARERESIRLKREAGEPGPWTDDPVLQRYRFCNIFREDDRTTAWFRENIREPLRDDPHKVVLATAGFRWFNRIEVGERIKDILLKEGWNSYDIRERLTGVKPIVTGAYMIKTPAKMNKLEGIIWCMRELMEIRFIFEVLMDKNCTLENGWEALTSAPYLGQFMAYEIITDLRHTCVLENATDIMSWANPGPGAARGLGWITHDDPSTYNPHAMKDREELMNGMRQLLGWSAYKKYWPTEWPRWELREVEHTLCEWDKWKRGCNGQSLKRRYRPSLGS